MGRNSPDRPPRGPAPTPPPGPPKPRFPPNRVIPECAIAIRCAYCGATTRVGSFESKALRCDACGAPLRYEDIKAAPLFGMTVQEAADALRRLFVR